MQLRDWVYLLTVTAACLVGFYLLPPPQPDLPPVNPGRSFFTLDPELPDFSAYAGVNEKKEAFFQFLWPLVEQENQRIATLRAQLLVLSNKYDENDSKKDHGLNPNEKAWIMELAEYYRVVASHSVEKPADTRWLMDRLLKRVDRVPSSLALAQAANESAWGTSRFALEGNNLYGQWCFKAGCGLVPVDRPQDANYEVAKFNSPRQSVRRYIHNLNTHFAYQEFRELRASQRAINQPLRGRKSVDTLERYSTRGEDYIRELRSMIRVNELEQYDSI